MSAIEEKKNRPPDKSSDFFKCVKIPLKHVLKNPDINLHKIFIQELTNTLSISGNLLFFSK